MINIVILASGPPKPNRERHTEINKNNNKVIIDDIIEKSIIPNTNLYIIIHPDNTKLLDHINSYHKNINILFSEDKTIYNTFKKSLSVSGDCILVCGDLINLKENDIKKFVDSKYASAICQYKIPWGNNIQGNGYIKRSDIGECIIKISEQHKSIFLGDNNVNNAIKFFKLFYPNKVLNPYIYNDLGTWMNYSFFFNIASNIHVNNFDNIGTVFYEHNVYDDND